MSDIHVLDGALRGNVVHKRYAFHFAIPVVDRVANASQDPFLVGFASAVPTISAAELTSIQNGEIVEMGVLLDYHSSETVASVVVRIRARYAGLEPTVLNRYRERYRQYLTALVA